MGQTVNKLTFLGTKEIPLKLSELINEYDEFFWAVAWGSFTNTAKVFFQNHEKIKYVSFGVTGCLTAPDFIDKLVGVENAKIVSEFSGGTFHPKIYGFRSNERFAAIVGSANFTFGGLSNNCEAATLIEGAASDPFFKDLVNFTEECASIGEPITNEYARKYRAKHRLASRLKKPPHDPMAGHRTDNSMTAAGSLDAMTWEQYVAKVKGARNHDIHVSLKLLRVAQSWFASSTSFSDLNLEQRNAIFGTLYGKQVLPEYPSIEWGWFGSMYGFGDLKNRVKENDSFLARAIDQIPHKGEVTRMHYEGFCEDYLHAFRQSIKKGKYASASRILALKRPDVFLCVNDHNRREAAKLMNFTKSNLNIENYWDWIVEVIGDSDWYNVSKPASPHFESELWEGRAAMLDTFLYSP